MDCFQIAIWGPFIVVAELRISMPSRLWDDGMPVARSRLAEKTNRGIPGTVVAMAQPAPISHMGQKQVRPSFPSRRQDGRRRCQRSSPRQGWRSNPRYRRNRANLRTNLAAPCPVGRCRVDPSGGLQNGHRRFCRAKQAAKWESCDSGHFGASGSRPRRVRFGGVCRVRISPTRGRRRGFGRKVRLSPE